MTQLLQNIATINRGATPHRVRFASPLALSVLPMETLLFQNSFPIIETTI
jgi:hypothetical protein